VKNDYGTEKEVRALNGLEEPLKKTVKISPCLINYHTMKAYGGVDI
jgi:hypothetical protein